MARPSGASGPLGFHDELTEAIMRPTARALLVSILLASLPPPSTAAEGDGYWVERRLHPSAVIDDQWCFPCWVSSDGLELYLSVGFGTPGQYDLYVLRRGSRDERFEAPERLLQLNSGARQFGLAIREEGDRRLIYFASNRAGSQWDDLYLAEYEGRSFLGAWPLAARVNSPVGDMQPCISADGLRLYYTSYRTDLGWQGNGQTDIYVATRSTTDDLLFEGAVVENLGSPVSSPRDEASPALSASGLTLFFSALSVPRPGGCAGGSDIWMAQRDSASDAFGPPVPVICEFGGGAENRWSPVLSADWPAPGSFLIYATNTPALAIFEVIYGDCPAPAKVRRTITPGAPRDPARACGDFREGDEFVVELRVTEVRQDVPGGCAGADRFHVEETLPDGWQPVPETIEGAARDGQRITWTLEGAEAGATITYRVIAAGGDRVVRFEGVVREDLDPVSERPTSAVEGDSELVPDAPFDGECGAIRCWNILGAYTFGGPGCPGDRVLDQDFLTDGVTTERSFLWFPGARIPSACESAAGCRGLLADPKGRNAGSVPTVLAWNDDDGLVDLGHEVYGGLLERTVAYAQIWVVNETAGPIEAYVACGSDDSIVIQFDGEEIWRSCTSRIASTCQFPDVCPVPVTLQPGVEHSLLVKCFQGANEWAFNVRLLDAPDGEPITDELSLRKMPEGICPRRLLDVRRLIASEDSIDIEGEPEPAWVSGEEYEVELRASVPPPPAFDSGCPESTTVRITETAPAGWSVTAATGPNGRIVDDGTAEWTLELGPGGRPPPGRILYTTRAGGGSSARGVFESRRCPGPEPRRF